MRLAVWAPLPPSPSGIADYVAETLPELARRCEVQVVVEEPFAVAPALREAFEVVGPEQAEAELDLYHLGNSPSHAYVYRAARRRPGVAVLHEWSLHHLVLHETVQRGEVWDYLHEMRRAHGERGTLAGRQVARGLGGDLLPALFPLNDRVLEGSLGVVGLTQHVCRRARSRLPGRPVLHLPHHACLPLDPLPSREEARAELGLPATAPLVVAPGLATAAKRLEVAVRALARLCSRHPGLELVVAGAVDPSLPLRQWAEAAGVASAVRVRGRLELADFARHLCAADVVLALRFPTHGEISGALLRTLGVGRPALVSAGTPAAEEFPEGVVVPVDPGPSEEDELVALLDHLLRERPLRERVGALARAHVAAHHGLAATVALLAGFLEQVHARREELRAEVDSRHGEDEGLLGYLLEEVRWGARDLGLSGVGPGLAARLAELVEPRP